MSSESEFTGSQFSEQGRTLPQPEPQPEPEPQQWTVSQAQTAPHQAAPQVILPKNLALGVILSFFIPGLGSMINGDVTRGAIILVAYAVGWVFTFILIGIPILVGAWIWGMADGYLSAVRWNQAHGIVS